MNSSDEGSEEAVSQTAGAYLVLAADQYMDRRWLFWVPQALGHGSGLGERWELDLVLWQDESGEPWERVAQLWKRAWEPRGCALGVCLSVAVSRAWAGGRGASSDLRGGRVHSGQLCCSHHRACTVMMQS